MPQQKQVLHFCGCVEAYKTRAVSFHFTFCQEIVAHLQSMNHIVAVTGQFVTSYALQIFHLSPAKIKE